MTFAACQEGPEPTPAVASGGQVRSYGAFLMRTSPSRPSGSRKNML